MTGEERERDDPGQAPAQAQPRAVVVAVDPARLELYARTLRLAEVPNLATLDLDEAEQLLIQHQPAVLVLDRGLPRIYILRLYGLVREVMDGPRVKVLFVGQQAGTSPTGDTDADEDASPDDYYLPGEPSPLGVAAQVCEMVAEADAARAAAAPAPAPADTAAPRDAEPATSAATAMPAATEAEREEMPATSATTADEPEPAVDDSAEPALVGAGVAAGVAESAPPAAPPADAESEPPRKRRRFDILMFRIGLVLLILGGLLAFIRPESFSLPISAPPTVAPASTPAAPTQQPAASPSPAALIDDGALPPRLAARLR